MKKDSSVRSVVWSADFIDPDLIDLALQNEGKNNTAQKSQYAPGNYHAGHL